MDNLVTAIIGGASGIIAAIITAVVSNRKVNKNIAVHDKSSEKHKELLSKEHYDIQKDINNANEKSNMLLLSAGKEVTEVRTTLLGLKDRIIETDTEKRIRLQNLDDAQKKLCSSAEDIGKFSEEFMRLATENKQLRDENSAVKQRLRQMENRVRSLENGRSVEEDEYEPDF